MPKKYGTNADRQKAYRQRKGREERNANALQQDKALIKIERPALRYYGGKWRIASWVIEQFPVHTCYVEPFAGGASILFQKQPSKFEVINDLDGDVVNFFDMLRWKPQELIRAILLTPFSREELSRAREYAEDPIEQARRLYVRCWQSFGSGTGISQTGWRYQIGAGDNSRASAIGSFNNVDHLWDVAERLKQVQIECDDALKVIARFDNPETLFYVDPPYVHSTRYDDSKRKGYKHEMTNDDHVRLAEVLQGIKGMAIVSGYSSGLYSELFAGWSCVQKQTNDRNGKEQIECLWISPKAARADSLPLFAV